jgi:NADH:ubiquinone oxidoreductase subunit K
VKASAGDRWLIKLGWTLVIIVAGIVFAISLAGVMMRSHG